MCAPRDGKNADDSTAVDRHYWKPALLLYALIAVLILILWLTSLVVEAGDPEKIFTTTILIGTGVGGLGTVLGLARSWVQDDDSSVVFMHITQTIGVWAVFIGTLASVMFPAS